MSITQQAKQKYKEYLEKVPELRRRQIENYTMLVFTFLALIIFLVFAINPTVGTIIGLRKQLKDGRVVKTALDAKLSALDTLDKSYATITGQLPAVYLSIPKTPDAPLVFAQLQALAKNDTVELASLETSSIVLTLTSPQTTPLPISLTATGSYANLIAFLTDTATLSRLLSFSEISFSKPDGSGVVTLTLKGQAYFKP
jgi:Tfp pilus assembly protein PilO